MALLLLITLSTLAGGLFGYVVSALLPPVIAFPIAVIGGLVIGHYIGKFLFNTPTY